MILPDAAKTVKQGANIANVKRKTCATMINEEKKKKDCKCPEILFWENYVNSNTDGQWCLSITQTVRWEIFRVCLMI